ncbi:hypothetical protein L6164_009469 [Bauhinia variegata]|uniref:Uncharacterized protein n=1 Tax=Bauhinia variegata TaxID=167791 RepID=A0ACB9PK16_BAUVA|nr:hypothetical protein L6164_009469 [Bauhinia variegata]
MELALSLGDASKAFSFLDKPTKRPNKDPHPGFCMALGGAFSSRKPSDAKIGNHGYREDQGQDETRASSDPPLQLELLPFTLVPRTHPSSDQLRIPWLSDARKPHNNLTVGFERISSDPGPRALDMNRLPAEAGTRPAEDADDGATLSSPNSAVSSFQMDFCFRNNTGRNKRENEGETERTSSRASDDEDNGSTRKKLRLSKEQSAFLEESFKEQTTLNPKQKLALAKQLNLRPRQVEVWFQNRRARTKLKQTEVDCEYLKRCCETLTEENKRMRKELQELRALKASQPFYMQLPATTLTMCPSCERVATNSSSGAPTATATNSSQISSPLSLSSTRVLPAKTHD